MHSTLLYDNYAGELMGLIVWNALAGIITLLAILRLLRSPREWFSYGVVSKLAWVLTAWSVSWHFNGALFPVGAVACLCNLRALRRREESVQALGVPYASGSPFDQDIR